MYASSVLVLLITLTEIVKMIDTLCIYIHILILYVGVH